MEIPWGIFNELNKWCSWIINKTSFFTKLLHLKASISRTEFMFLFKCFRQTLRFIQHFERIRRCTYFNKICKPEMHSMCRSNYRSKHDSKQKSLRTKSIELRENSRASLWTWHRFSRHFPTEIHLKRKSRFRQWKTHESWEAKNQFSLNSE